MSMEILIRCPICGSEMVESWPECEDGDTGKRYDIGIPVFHPDQDDYEPGNLMGTRGEFTSIPLMCGQEWEHRFVVMIGNHKGHQYLGVYNLEDDSSLPLTISSLDPTAIVVKDDS